MTCPGADECDAMEHNHCGHCEAAMDGDTASESEICFDCIGAMVTQRAALESALAAHRKALAALVNAMPKCGAEDCAAPAECIDVNEEEWCAEHVELEAADYVYAARLRAALALLKETL